MEILMNQIITTNLKEFSMVKVEATPLNPYPLALKKLSS